MRRDAMRKVTVPNRKARGVGLALGPHPSTRPAARPGGAPSLAALDGNTSSGAPGGRVCGLRACGTQPADSSPGEPRSGEQSGEDRA